MGEDRGAQSHRAAVAGLSVCFFAVTLLALLSVATQIGRPAPGFVVWDNLVVPAIGTPSWPGIQAGIPLRSVLVEADGQPLRRAAELRALVRARAAGTPVTYVFQRGATRTRVVVPTTALHWRDVLPVYSGYLLAGLTFFATAVIVFAFKPRLPAARASLALGTVLGGAMVLALDLFSAFWLQRLYFVAESLMPAALLHFALCFPEEKAVVRRHPALRWLVYVPFVPLAALQNLYLAGDPEAHLRINDWVYIATACAGLVTFGSLLHSFVAARSPLARQQAKVVLVGVTAAAFCPSLGLLAITVFGLQVPMNALSPFFICYPLSIAYAIGRHDLFNVDRYLRLGVAYGALSALVVVSYGALLLAFERWTGGGRQLPPGLVPGYLFAVVVLFHPLQVRVQALVDRLFSRQAYSYRGTVEATSRALASLLDSEAIAESVLTTLTDVMAIDWAAVVLRQPDAPARVFARPPARAAACVAAVSPASDSLERLARGPRLFSSDEGLTSARGPLDAALATGLRGLGAALVLPLRFRDQPLGVVFVGAKRSGAYYSGDDLDLLETLMQQSALALTNAHAYEVIRQTQAELVEAERFAAVGELAAAVAHGIRNPLAGIRGVAQVAREDVAGDTRIARDLDMVMREADRLEQRVRSILDLARPLTVHATAGDLGRLLGELSSAMRHRLPPAVQLELALSEHLPQARFDPASLTEVIETIVVNAVEAMDGCGTLRLGAEVDPGDPAHVVVTIADSGPGIAPHALGQIFELFYTTKRSGTGVGLATAKRLVERQAGTLQAASRPDAGATFSIRLAAVPPTGHSV